MALSKEIYPNSKLESTETIQKVLKLTTVQSVGGIKCDLCKITFSTKQPYDSHYLNHCNDKTLIKYTCVVCDKTYPAYHTFRDHCYIQHVLKDKFKCSECSKCFPKISHLNEHVSTMHTFRCLLKSCKKKFKTKADLHHHQMVHKNNKNKPPYKCKSCQKQIHNPDDCEMHIDAHFALTYFCPICNHHITTETAKNHLTTHFGDETPDGKQPHHDNDPTNPNVPNPMETPSDSSVNTIGGVRCCHCNQLFKDKMEIDLHFMEYHKDEEITYTCNVCKKQFVKYSLFGDHCYFHYSKTRFECEKCSKTFDRLVYLVSHTETCTSTTTTSFSCAVCKSVYPSDFKLQRHMRRAGHEANELQCLHTGCNATFESQKELLLHRKRHHEGHKNFCQTCGMHFHTLQSCYKHLDVHKKQQFNCPVCDHLSHDKYKMMQHIPRHFTTMFHACKICGKIYEEKRRFLQHTKTHDNVKNHKCNYCGKSFTKSNHLQQHINVHTGMKPYKCVACPKTFASYPNWNKHLRKIHNIDAKNVKRPEVNIDQANGSLPITKVAKIINSNDFDEFGDDSMGSNSDVENEINAIEKSLSDSIENTMDNTTNERHKIINAAVDNRGKTNNTTASVKIGEKINNTTPTFEFGEKFKNITANNKTRFIDSDGKTDNTTTTYEFGEKIVNTTLITGDKSTNSPSSVACISPLLDKGLHGTPLSSIFSFPPTNNTIKYLVIDAKTNNTTSTFEFDEKTKNITKQNDKNADIGVENVGMELQEHLDDDAVDATESEMLEELLDIGILPEPPHQVVSVKIPQLEYGPDFINADSTLPTTSPGELINLDDHLLPHIDPLLTIKCQAGPDYTTLTNCDQYAYDTDDQTYMNYQNDTVFPNQLYLYDQNDLSVKNDVAQPNLVWGPTTIFTSYV